VKVLITKDLADIDFLRPNVRLYREVTMKHPPITNMTIFGEDIYEIIECVNFYVDEGSYTAHAGREKVGRIDDVIAEYLKEGWTTTFTPVKAGADPDHQKTTHELKSWPEYWSAVVEGRKTFDVRKGNDRTYRVGDDLLLKEWDHTKKEYTGRETRRTISYVMHGGAWIPDDVWVLGFEA